MYEKCRKSKISLGWSDDIKGIIIPLFLILLSNNKNLSKVQEDVVKSIEKRLCEGSYVDDKSIAEYYYNWRSYVEDFDADKHLRWCETEVTNRVKAILSNKYRGAYGKAAQLVVLLGEALETIGSNNMYAQTIDKYIKMYPRHIAFKCEIKSLKK